MNQSKVEQVLEKLFMKYRLVFWQDEKTELRAEFESIKIEGVEKIIVQNNEYGLKYRMLKDQPRQKFLIFREGKRPEDSDNWLLDLELAHEEFRADQDALWLSEIGLGLEFRHLIQDHREFFSNKRRKEAFVKLLDPAQDTESVLKRKMLAVCVGAKQPRIDNVLEAMLDELSSGSSDGFHLIERCKLEEFLWGQVKSYYLYDSATPGIEDFAIELFKSCFALDLGERAALKDSAIGFLNRWKNNRLHEEAFEALSEKYVEILGIQKQIESRDFRKLTEIDYFEVLDRKILNDLVVAVEDQTISKDECSHIIRQRRMSYWYKTYEHAYEAIDYASEFMHAIGAMDLTPHSFDDGVFKYASEWYKIDQFYRKFIHSYRAFPRGDLLRRLYERIEQFYSNKYLLTLSDNWQKIVDAQPVWSGFEALMQRNFFLKHIQPVLDADKKVYVIISDALRYEIGKELVGRIQQEDRFDAKLEYAISQLPSYTQLGMASLLPNKVLSFANDDTGKVLVDNIPASGTAGRDRILKTQNKSGTAIQWKDFMGLDRDQSRDILKENDFLYIYHNHIDFVGDKRDSEERVFEAAETTITEVIDAVKKLTNANATNIIITADHGFLFQNKPIEESDYLSADAVGEKILYHDRRFVIGKGLVANPSFKSFTAVALGLEGDMEVQIPKSINRLRKQGSGSRFVHGGATLQEILIPVIKVNKKRQSDISRVEVEILQGATNNITSGQHSIVLYQREAVTEKMQSRQLRAGVYSVDGDLISDSHDLLFDSTSENPRDREMRVRFILARKAEEFNNRDVYLRLEEVIQGTSHYREYKSMKFVIRRSFMSDFDL